MWTTVSGLQCAHNIMKVIPGINNIKQANKISPSCYNIICCSCIHYTLYWASTLILKSHNYFLELEARIMISLFSNHTQWIMCTPIHTITYLLFHKHTAGLDYCACIGRYTFSLHYCCLWEYCYWRSNCNIQQGTGRRIDSRQMSWWGDCTRPTSQTVIVKLMVKSHLWQKHHNKGKPLYSWSGHLFQSHTTWPPYYYKDQFQRSHLVHYNCIDLIPKVIMIPNSTSYPQHNCILVLLTKDNILTRVNACALYNIGVEGVSKPVPTRAR